MPGHQGKNAVQRGESTRRRPPDRQAQGDEKTADPEFELLVEKARNAIPAGRIPIEDPFLEKKIIETLGMNGYALYLVTDRPQGISFSGGFGERFSEVYRRCFEISQSFNVITDFVAFFPELAFDSSWLTDLVKDRTAFNDPNPRSDCNRLLMALANGFRRAARPTPRLKTWFRATRLFAARDAQRTMQKEFADSLKPNTLDWKDADEEEKDRRVSKLVHELVQKNPPLEPATERLTTHLKAGRLRKASLAAVGILFHTPLRKLEGKPLPERA
jgi:hypothetical protein